MAIALDAEWKEGFDVEDDEVVEENKKNNFRLIS